jgi:hypothetical protein
MIQLSPSDFLAQFCTAFPCQDHHFTGPITAQQSEGNGSVYHIEGQILAGFARKHGGPVLEIGSDLGISSRYIAEGLGPPAAAGPQLFCIDPHHKWHATPEWSICQLGIDEGYQLAKTIDWSWAFIDGDHRYEGVRADIDLAIRSRISRLFFHDTSPSCPKPTNPSDGSEARYAVLDAAQDYWAVYDITTPCGLIYVDTHGNHN